MLIKSETIFHGAFCIFVGAKCKKPDIPDNFLHKERKNDEYVRHKANIILQKKISVGRRKGRIKMSTIPEHTALNNYLCIARKTFIFIFIFFLTAGFVAASGKRQPAFPGAEGFGRFASGGRGGDVYHVTNLNDSGCGSLRNGLETAIGPRTIVFDLSGTIYLRKTLSVQKSNITIAGQTAPGDGITLANHSFYLSANNLIVRYIRCRLGDAGGAAKDAVSITAGCPVMVDHLTVSWSVDETLSCQSEDVDSLTVQWCMITESLNNSVHDKGAHGYGGILGSTRQTFHHNLYAHHASRNPKVTGRRHCEVDFRNNVIYNWGHNSCYDGTASYINWVNNYYKCGPATSDKVKSRIFELSDQDIEPGKVNRPDDSRKYETTLYADGNYVDRYPAVSADNWSGGIVFTNGATEAKNRSHVPFEFPRITEQTAVEAYPRVLKSAGASLIRDVIDNRIVEEVTRGIFTYGRNGLIDSQMEAGGLPVLRSAAAPVDTDLDGMPDSWEKEQGLDPKNPADRNEDPDKNGYTNLEEYLQSIITKNGDVKYSTSKFR
jgi:pectate lyase